MHRDISEKLAIAHTIVPILGNNTTEGTGVGVDLRGYDAATVVFNFGISGDTLSGSLKVAPSVEESADNSNWSTVAAGNLVGALTEIDDAAEDPAVQVVGYRGSKRYIRAKVTFTGTHTNGMPIAATVIRGYPKVIT